jgi:tetratricopeptide (TPR) repeat protein
MTFRRTLGSIAVGLVLVQGSAATAHGQATPNADDDRDQRTMQRFLEILEKNPRRGTALDRVYGYHVERGTLDGLIKTYRDRTLMSPGDGQAWLLLGLFEAQRGRDGDAAAALRNAVQLRPKDPLPAYYLGQAQVLVGQPDAAARSFEEAIARKPARQDLLEVYQALGRIYQRAHRNDEALAVWNRLEAEFPNDLRVKEQIAEILAEESQNAEALQRYEELVGRVSDSYRKVTLRMQAAELKVRLGRSKDAIRDFERLLGQLNPESWLFREVRRNIEEVFLRNDDVAGLAAYYEGWIKSAPEDVDALARLGRTLAQLGRSAEARTWLEKAVKLAPTRRELRLALIAQLVEEKKIGEAEAQYAALSKNEPNNPDLIRDWGRMILGDTTRPEPERKKAAAEVWRKLLERRKDEPLAAVQLADLFRQAGMIDEAIDLYKQAVALAPDAVQYREYLGQYYQSLNRKDEALEAWRGLAAGKNRNPRTLARLAEVLASFGHPKEALVPIADAIALEPDNFDLRTQYADVLVDVENYPEALKQLAEAEKLADNDDRRELVMTRTIKTLTTANELEAHVAALSKELEAGKEPTAARWLRLARYSEAEQKLTEATAAVRRAVELEPQSVAAWIAAARIHEGAGNLSAASDALRRLTVIDRRARAGYLMNIAKLETRLGRREQALDAGRELLAASPGNPESFRFFADLCFQLGDTEGGLDTLRRSVRANPSDPQAALELGSALAREFRTEEANELYWRAFDKTKELDARLGIVGRLTELALQQNQFDRLVARFERLERDQSQQREMTICLAQAYQASGDFGTARQTLERLLTNNSRDTQLFLQLSALAESEGDLVAATKYLRQVYDLAPSDDVAVRLGQLYVRAGEVGAAEELWTKLAGSDREKPARVLQAIDSLIANGKREAVLAITERLVRENPKNWEALYREGATLAALDKPDEAAQRFRAILNLRFRDDEAGEAAKARQFAPAGRPAGLAAAPPASAPFSYTTPAIQLRQSSVFQARMASGVDMQASMNRRAPAWYPADFGQARIAALAWLYRLGMKGDSNDAFVELCREAKDKAPHDPRAAWDWYYLAAIRQAGDETYSAARSLAQLSGADPEALWIYLASLSQRPTGPLGAGGIPVNFTAPPDGNVRDRVPPLADAELELVLRSFRALKTRRPEWVTTVVRSNVITELKRAKRFKDEEEIYRDTISSASDPAAIATALNASGEKGDVEAVFALVEKAQRQIATATSPSGRYGSSYLQSATVQAMARAMAARASEKGLADVVTLLDRFDAIQQKHRKPGAPFQSTSRNAAVSRNNYVQVWLTPTQQIGVQWDFPAPIDAYDLTSLNLLRAALELYKRQDLTTDLLGHFRTRTTAGSERERLHALLSLCYLDWWSDDKDEAAKLLVQAAELAPHDVELKLQLVDLRELRNERDDALAVLDTIEAADNAMMQRRETTALRLSVSTGNIDRARLAAERLFGLRLDTDLQIQLASQMHQLGMHELAEAVLARARNRAGNRITSLTSLMNQYQRQNKPEIAIQVAHQILRRGPSAPSPNGAVTQDDLARNEALAVLARSGKLNDLIARVETQAKAAPQSLGLKQTLADYYKAANDRDKARAVFKEMARLRPDDARMQFQLGQQLLDVNDVDGSIAMIRSAIKRDPALLGTSFARVYNTFRRANKMDELAALLQEIDIKALGNTSLSANILANMMSDPKTRAPALKVFRKLWQAAPGDRAMMMRYFYDESMWQIPEVYDYAREVLIPTREPSAATAWSVTNIINYQNDGQVGSILAQLLVASARQNKIEPLRAEVAATVKRFPGWACGRAILGILQARTGRTAEAKATLESLFDDQSVVIPHDARWVIAQEIENFGPLAAQAERLYKGALEQNYESRGMTYPNNPARRLIALYRRVGRLEDARSMLLKLAETSVAPYYYDPVQAVAQRAAALGTIGNDLLALGFPVDAVTVFGRVTDDLDKVPDDYPYYPPKEMLRQQSQDGMTRALKGLGGEALARSMATVFKPRSGLKPGDQALDLGLIVQPKQLNGGTVTSLLDATVRSASESAEAKAEIKTIIAKLLHDRPDDLSVNITAAVASFTDPNPEPANAAVARLRGLIERAPLEDLKGARANSRQRADAARRIGAWLVARECWKRESMREAGDALAASALDAAKRLTDPLWGLVMLREWGQVLLDRGDRAGAERLWGEILDQVLANPSARQQTAHDQRALPPARASVPAVPATPAAPASPAPAAGAPIKKISQLATPGNTKARSPGTGSARPAASARPAPRNAGAAPITLDRYMQAMELGKLAAERDLFSLSFRAVRESLKAGPPIANANQEGQTFGMPGMMSGGLVVSRVRRASGFQVDSFSQQVENQVSELERLWLSRNAPAGAVYETLRDVVMPPARPDEIFVYARPFFQSGFGNTQSLGSSLVRWAVRAGKGAELRSTLEKRRTVPASEVPALALLSQLGTLTRDHALTNQSLASLQERLKKDTLQNTAELALLGATPALDVEPTAQRSADVLALVVKNLSALAFINQLGSVYVALVRHSLAHAAESEARARSEEYFRTVESMAAANRNGDYAYFLRKSSIAEVAGEYARVGRWSDVLELLGRIADIPTPVAYRGSDATVGVALGKLASHLQGLPAKERYVLLRDWTMPNPKRRSVRLVAANVPVDSPPAVFVPTSRPGAVEPASASGPTIAATFVLLCDAARESGRLDELAAALKDAAGAKIENAELLHTFLETWRGRGNDVAAALEARLVALEPTPNPINAADAKPQQPFDCFDVILAQAVLNDDSLGDRARAMFDRFVNLARTTANFEWMFVPRLQLALARRIAAQAGSRRLPIEETNSLALWQPAADQVAAVERTGDIPPLWVEHEGQLAHLGGPQDQYLFVNVPLTGTFVFEGEADHPRGGGGAVGYAGSMAEVQGGGQGNYWQVGTLPFQRNGGQNFSAVTRPILGTPQGRFDRLTVSVEPGKIRYLINDRLFHEEKSPSPTSPWLFLFASRERTVHWRNLSLTGNPVIPDEVALTFNDRLDGWASHYYYESKYEPPNDRPANPSAPVAPPPLGRPEDHDWYAHDGTITGRMGKNAASNLSQNVQSRLHYHRPLRAGDSLRYEFFYRPGQTMVHPALDRVAFLLEPDGVRLHWMTLQGDNNWTGLKADNAVVVPAQRRGAAKLSLKDGDWNAVTVEIGRDAARVLLNDSLIYEYPLEPGAEPHFGFFHYKDQTEAKVRKVVLRGNWPRSLSKEQLSHLLARSRTDDPPADRRARQALIGDEILTDNAGSVLAAARRLAPEERYAALVRWVLPGTDHVGFRLQGDATASDPAPPVAGDDVAQLKGRRLHSSGVLEAPAFDLIATAAGLNRLDDLGSRIDKAEVRNDLDRRGQLALLAMVRAAQSKDAEAEQLLKQMRPLHARLGKDDRPWQRWPELVAASSALNRPRLYATAMALLDDMVVDQIQKFGSSVEWERQVRHVRAVGQVLGLPDKQRRAFGTAPGLAHWTPVTLATAEGRGAGHPQAHWNYHDGTWTHYSGHGNDYLYLNVPIRGNFEVNCELSSFGWRETRLSYGGLMPAIKPDKKTLEVTQHGVGLPDVTVDPPLNDLGDWYAYRLVVRDGLYTASINGRTVYERTIPTVDGDPWLALQAPWQSGGGVRKLSISGTPVVPDVLNLSALPDLTGWIGAYYGEPVNANGGRWTKRGEEIIFAPSTTLNEEDTIVMRGYRRAMTQFGTQLLGDDGARTSSALPNLESVLQYHRPMLENGTIEYEFFYERGKMLTHPAIDRLVFLLEPDGVAIHWLTDAQHDRTRLASDNRTIEPNRRRGAGSLPLRAAAWNRMQVKLDGDTMTLILNGTTIYERPLEATNQRIFGLFHYANNTGVRVRNVTYRGEWPRSLPANSELGAR